MWFLSYFNKTSDCFTLHSLAELNDPARMSKVFEFLGVDLKSGRLELTGRKNITPMTQTQITTEDEQQFEEVLTEMPASYLEIFRREPYVKFKWSRLIAR